MTWKEFREGIERRLKEEGISEEIEIEYIDFSWVNSVDMLCIGVEDYKSRSMIRIWS